MAASTLERVCRVREVVAESGREILVCVDGGITRDNVAGVAEAGADLIVTGSAVFDGKDPAGNAALMLSLVKDGASRRRA